MRHVVPCFVGSDLSSELHIFGFQKRETTPAVLFVEHPSDLSVQVKDDTMTALGAAIDGFSLPFYNVVTSRALTVYLYSYKVANNR